MKLRIIIKVFEDNNAFHPDADREIELHATSVFLRNAAHLLSDDIIGAVEDCIDEVEDRIIEQERANG